MTNQTIEQAVEEAVRNRNEWVGGFILECLENDIGASSKSNDLFFVKKMRSFAEALQTPINSDEK